MSSFESAVVVSEILPTEATTQVASGATLQDGINTPGLIGNKPVYTARSTIACWFEMLYILRWLYRWSHCKEVCRDRDGY
jgi:hypothetical protein